MNDRARGVQRTYLTLTLLTTLAASFIWGINTLFLLDAGLNNTEAFAANAFFTLGMLVFEVPTGVVADTRGRRLSFMLGTATLVVSTLLYMFMWQISAPFWAWAVASVLLGLGFTSASRRQPNLAQPLWWARSQPPPTSAGFPPCRCPRRRGPDLRAGRRSEPMGPRPAHR